MATVFTLDPLLPFPFPFSLAKNFVMANACRGYAKARGNTQVKIPTSLSVSRKAVANDARVLNDFIVSTPGPKTVLAWSRGAMVAGCWLDTYGRETPVPASELSLILLGNPERGRQQGAKSGTKYLDGSDLVPTPTDTAYSVLDIARRGDSWADAAFDKPGVHLQYFLVDLGNLKPLSREVVGNTEYVVVP